MLAALALACAVLTGCAPPGFACSAVWYPVVAHVVLSEPRIGVKLELCTGEGCEPGLPMAFQETQSAYSSVEPMIDPGFMSITGGGVTGWSADMLGAYPVLGYRLSDASGTTIAQGSVEVEWVRTGGTERCGGPREAHVELPF